LLQDLERSGVVTWQKAPADLQRAFLDALPDDPAVQRRKMFGYPAAFVNGNMFAGVYQTNVVVRLSAQSRADAMAGGAEQFEPMPGRPMREYVVVPPGHLEDRAQLSRWLDEAFRFTAAMPVKEPKPRGSKKAG
jgi:TfoX/Sxy family transcriptional regulator of competence genes